MSSAGYGGTVTEGGWVGSRVPAMDDAGGFFFPQLTQLGLGTLHPPLRQPVLRLAMPTAAIATSAQYRREFRMALGTFFVTWASQVGTAELPQEADL